MDIVRRRFMATILQTGCVVSLAVLAPTRAIAQPTLSDPTLQVQTVVSTGLSQPTTMAFVGPNDILVLQKGDGQVKRVVSGVVSGTLALDVPVNQDSERGLLGIAINTQNPPRVFLYYTEAASDGGTPIANRVYRYTWNATLGVLQSPQLILDLPVTPGPNHNGGVLLLGPVPVPGPGQVGDGSFLHVVIGDLNRDGQLENFPAGAAPDDTAVILRVQQDGTPAPGNPFVPYCSGTTSITCPNGTGCPGGQTCRTQVARYFAYGVRNSFGMAIDPLTGDLWDTENGPGSFDEVNFVAPGFNSGWEQIMGPDSRDPQGVGDLFTMPGGQSAYSDPEFSWVATVAPTALVFPAGSALGSAYDEMALVGDNNTGQLYRFPLNAGRDGFDLSGFTGLGDLVADSTAERNALAIGSGFGVVTDMKIGPDGALYVVSLSNGDIYRISQRITPTFTPTATRSFTGTPTLTRTTTRTFTVTPTFSATVPPTATPVPPATATPTRTFSATPTSSVVPTATRTFTATPTSSAVPTATRTFTFTATATRTFTAPPTLTSTPPPTATRTRTPTATLAPSATPSQPAAFACPSAPQICRLPTTAGSGEILLRDNRNNDNRDALVWRWVDGAATSKSDFGNPLQSTSYELCIFDASGLIASASAPAGGTCGTGPCWRDTAAGFRYADNQLTPDGLSSIILRQGSAGQAEIIIRGSGPNLPMPPNLAALRSPVTVQLKRSGSSLCWGATYSFPPAIRNDATVFNDTAN